MVCKWIFFIIATCLHEFKVHLSRSLISTAACFQLQTAIYVCRFDSRSILNDVTLVTDEENEMSKRQPLSIDVTRRCQKYNSIPRQTLIKLWQAEHNDTSVTFDTRS